MSYSTDMLSKESRYENRIDNLILREGIILKVYQDIVGYDHIGVGHKITSKESKSGLIYNISYKSGITKAQALLIFKKDLNTSDKLADRLLVLKDIDKTALSRYQIDAIRDMVYQLGARSASMFKTVFRHIREANYAMAAKAAAKSKWYRQTKERVIDFQKRIVMNLK